MNLRKLLFTISMITLQATTASTVVACNHSVGIKSGAATLVNFKLDTTTSLKPSEVSYIDPTVVQVSEITKYINIIVQKALLKFLNVNDAKYLIDYKLSIVEYQTQEPIARTYNFTTDDKSERTFSFWVISIEGSEKLIGSSSKYQVGFLKVASSSMWLYFL